MSLLFRSSNLLIRVLALAVIAAVISVGAVVFAPSANAGPYCGIYWGSLEKSDSQSTVGAITNVRAGRHDCFDRMVVDINGGIAGYDVQYVPGLRADPSDLPVSLRGGAKLQVIVRAHTEDVDTGLQLFQPANPNELVNVSGFSTFRQIKLVGPSFEGVTQIGLGVRARLPFRVFTLDGPAPGSRLVIDVAHYW